MVDIGYLSPDTFTNLSHGKLMLDISKGACILIEKAQCTYTDQKRNRRKTFALNK